MNEYSPIPMRPIAALLILTGFVLIGAVFGSLIFALICKLIPSYDQILTQGGVATGNYYRSMILINFPMMFLIPTLIAAKFYRPNATLQVLSLPKAPTLYFILLGLAIIILSQPGLNLVGEFNQQLSLPQWMQSIETMIKESEASAALINNAIVQTNSVNILIFNLFILAVLPGVCEELLFRGLILPIFIDWIGKKHLAIWLSAFIFSFIHFQFFGFVPRLLLGAILGYLVVYSGSIWPAVIAHGFNNGLVTVLEYLKFNHYIDSNIDSIGIGSSSWLGVISLLLTLLFFPYITKKFTSKNRYE